MYHNYSMYTIIDDLNSSSVKNYILDTDTANEVDDQFAIAYAMLAKEINLLAINAAPFVNDSAPTPDVGAELSYLEMVKVRDMVDPEGKMNIPCYRGSGSYMTSINKPVISEAAENIVRIVKETDGIVYIGVIGCFTNVASALLLDPSIKDKAVILLIGANSFDYEKGDCNEFNLAQDRLAARVIFECGVPVVVLPAMGGTERLYTTGTEVTFYLKDKAGQIGNYLISLFEREEGGLYNKDGSCNCKSRIIWDLAAIAVPRLGDRAAVLNVVPARTIDPDGYWRMSEHFDRRMIMASDFRRWIIMPDFYTLMQNSDLK